MTEITDRIKTTETAKGFTCTIVTPELKVEGIQFNRLWSDGYAKGETREQMLQQGIEAVVEKYNVISKL